MPKIQASRQTGKKLSLHNSGKAGTLTDVCKLDFNISTETDLK